MSLYANTVECDDGTASRDAFKKMFRVGLQNKFLLTPVMRHYMGTPTSGDRNLDRALQDNFIEIMASPIACVEYAELGAPLKFRNSSTPNQILNILMQHLKNWEYIDRNFYNVALPPAEDIDAIHMFCDSIIKYGALNAKRDDAWLLRSVRADGQGGGGLGRTSTRIRLYNPEEEMEETPMSAEEIRAAKVARFTKSFSRIKGAG